jgi:acetate---CoA ligase (ADP-forming)
VINATLPAASTFSTALLEIDALRAGGISMVCQSGGIATTAFSMVLQAGFGFRYLVSSGNEVNVDFADYLNAFAEDPQTHIIGGYLEGIGDGDRFVRALATARARGKSVVLIKAGTTGATARAAQAHTGALVGDDRVVDAVFEEMGVMRARSVEELVDLCCMLVGNRHRVPAGRGVGVVTFGGGNGVLGADQCAQSGLATPALSDEGVQALRPLLISVATAANPLDLTPTTAFRDDAMAKLPRALDVLAAQPGIDSLLFVVGSMAAKATQICDVIRRLAERASKPVCVSWPSPPRVVPAALAADGIYSFLDPSRAIRSLAHWAAHGEALRRPVSTTVSAPPFDWSKHVVVDVSQLVVPEPTCHRILAAAGLTVAEGLLVHDELEAVRAASAMAAAVVMKGITPKVTHRAAAGLISFDRRTEREVRDAYRQLQARAAHLDVELDGVLVQRMHGQGAELIVTAFRDPHFGVIVSCGRGGGLTEVIDDVRTARAPVSVELATWMIDRLRTRSRMKDACGALDTTPAARFIARFSELAVTAPWERFVFEINPVLWRRDDAVALDGLLIVG